MSERVGSYDVPGGRMVWGMRGGQEGYHFVHAPVREAGEDVEYTNEVLADACAGAADCFGGSEEEEFDALMLRAAAKRLRAIATPAPVVTEEVIREAVMQAITITVASCAGQSANPSEEWAVNYARIADEALTAALAERGR